MERKGDTLILGTRECTRCDADGTYVERKACRYYNKAVTAHPGRVCPACGAKNKHSHQHLETGRRPICQQCNGSKLIAETRFDTMPMALFASIPMKVYPSDRGISFNEAYLGIGCVWSCQDYGEHKKLSHEELIAKLREPGHSVQACKVVNIDLEFCDHIGIFTNEQGYSLRPVAAGWKHADPSAEVSTGVMLAGGRTTLDIYR